MEKERISFCRGSTGGTGLAHLLSKFIASDGQRVICRQHLPQVWGFPPESQLETCLYDVRVYS
jgi:hypothetical protein